MKYSPRLCICILKILIAFTHTVIHPQNQRCKKQTSFSHISINATNIIKGLKIKKHFIKQSKFSGFQALIAQKEGRRGANWVKEKKQISRCGLAKKKNLYFPLPCLIRLNPTYLRSQSK